MPRKVLRWFYALLSLVVPGLGQALAGDVRRGLYVFLGAFILAGLTVFTAAQRARFPEQVYGLSAQSLLRLGLVSLALFLALRWVFGLVARRLAQDEFTRRVANGLFVVLVVVFFSLAGPALLQSLLPPEAHKQLYTTLLLGMAVVLAWLWWWSAQDAWRLAGQQELNWNGFIALVLVGTVILGTRIVGIDLPKAIREYRETGRILGDILWPWRAAFDYRATELRATARVQAPCPPGSTPPPVNQPSDEGPWVVVEPTCGDLSTRDEKGRLTYGTLLTIRGGGFVPGKKVRIKWENPIGNEFTPRGVGPTEIEVGPDGTFETQLYIPDVIIPDIAQGPQIHKLHVVQPGALKFTGKLSREMKLALQAMLESIMIGLMATFVGMVFAVPLSFLAARNLMFTLRTSPQGLVGGVLGLALGGFLGWMLARQVSALLGGIERAPVAVAVTGFLLVGGAALAGFRFLGWALDRLSEHLPGWVNAAIRYGGFGLIGAALGWPLGLGYAYGILGIVWDPEEVAAAADGFARIGAGLGAAGWLYLARRWAQGFVPIGQWIYTVTRLVLNVVRSIEPLIWGLVGVIWVGLGPFAGFIALTIHTIAALGKLYSEAIESIHPGPIEAIQSTGANRVQTIMFAVLPQVLPHFTAFSLYRWDINVRMSTVIGLVGGGGIGFLLIQWIRQVQYEHAGLAVWLITITVATLDFISASVRKRLV